MEISSFSLSFSASLGLRVLSLEIVEFPLDLGLFITVTSFVVIDLKNLHTIEF